MKTCLQCGLVLPLTQFRRLNGQQPYASRCRKCARNPGPLQMTEKVQSKPKRTPLWADHEKIRAVYAHAAYLRARGQVVEVDHIVPLRGRHASGLHTHDNLRVIPAKENHVKNNGMPIDPYGIEPTWKALGG